MKTWNEFPAAGPTALGLLALVTAPACDPGPDGGQTAASSAAESVRAADDSVGMALEEATDGARSDTPAPESGRDPPSVRPSEGPKEDTVEQPPDSRGRYFVRLSSGADPQAVAERHGVEPLEIFHDPVPAFYAALDSGQVVALRRDTVVASLAREIHEGDTLRPRPLRGTVPPSESAGG